MNKNVALKKLTKSIEAYIFEKWLPLSGRWYSNNWSDIVQRFFYIFQLAAFIEKSVS